VTGVQTCALPIWAARGGPADPRGATGSACLPRTRGGAGDGGSHGAAAGHRPRRGAGGSRRGAPAHRTRPGTRALPAARDSLCAGRPRVACGTVLSLHHRQRTRLTGGPRHVGRRARPADRTRPRRRLHPSLNPPGGSPMTDSRLYIPVRALAGAGAALLLSLTGCASTPRVDPAATVEAADDAHLTPHSHYYPLEVGNRWSYRIVGSSGGLQTVELVGRQQDAFVDQQG